MVPLLRFSGRKLRANWDSFLRLIRCASAGPNSKHVHAAIAGPSSKHAAIAGILLVIMTCTKNLLVATTVPKFRYYSRSKKITQVHRTIVHTAVLLWVVRVLYSCSTHRRVIMSVYTHTVCTPTQQLYTLVFRRILILVPLPPPHHQAGLRTLDAPNCAENRLCSGHSRYYEHFHFGPADTSKICDGPAIASGFGLRVSIGYRGEFLKKQIN